MFFTVGAIVLPFARLLSAESYTRDPAPCSYKSLAAFRLSRRRQSLIATQTVPRAESAYLGKLATQCRS